MLRPPESVAGMYPQPDPGKIAGSDTADHRLHPVVSGRRSFRLDPQRRPRQVQLVVNHDQSRSGVSSCRSSRRLYRPAAQVHVRLRLGQHHRLARRSSPPRPAPRFSLRETRTLFAAASASTTMKPEIVRREFVFGFRDSQPATSHRNPALARPWPQRRTGYFFFSLSLFRRPRLPLPSCPS